ncbi:PLxRFG domain-containing protein [Pseudodesulfovibrio tunisiensis]|uniref:PLxRFG domain-containing protein n=1 Tax=Pseudodesulfovibrio tunisiensis TaxID=463192 RepID=UPI001FB4F19E|nr:PLxRFG domain-containing protein [Pseudodesulfovibrio tunisiensis]
MRDRNHGRLPKWGEAAARGLTDKPSRIAKQAARKDSVPSFVYKLSSGDLSSLQEVCSLPHWIAKRFPAFDAIYRRQLTRMDERAKVLRESLEEVEDFFADMSREDQASLRDMIWKIDGRKLPGMNLDKFIAVRDDRGRDVIENGRVVLEMNPRYHEMFEAWLDRQPVSDKVKKALLALRTSLDRDFLRAYDAMREMAEVDDDTIKAFRTNINHVHNYFPHKRYGAYYIQIMGDNRVGRTESGNWAVFNGAGDIVSDEFAKESTAQKYWRENRRGVVYREHFDAANKASASRKLKAKWPELQKRFPDIDLADSRNWDKGENKHLPDELYEFPIDTNAMEQIINAAADKVEDRKRGEEIRTRMAEAVSDIMKARGWSAATIGRKGVPGYETEDIQGILYDYKAGLSGWITKMQASRDFTKLLGKIDAKDHPREYVYATNYVQNMLRNGDRIDRTVGNVKALAFLWYLGFNLKTAALNLTQNLIVGVPRLSMETRDGGFRYAKAAMATLTDAVTKGKHLPEDEARLLNDLYREDVITEGFLNEIRGRVQGVSLGNLWNKLLRWAGMPMAIAERFNRASLALAAYRAARDGKLKQHPGRKMNFEAAKAFAEDIVRDSHFVYGKTNLPQPLRNSVAGRAANPVYTFRTFSHNILSIWSWMLRTQGREGRTAFAKSMLGTALVGGFTALPFYATIMHLFQWLTGDDDDWTEEIRKRLPEGDVLRDIVSYGLPAGAGFSLGGSVGLETPVLARMEPGATLEENIADNLGDILGIPWDLIVTKPSRFMKARKAGDDWRAFEEVAPTIVRNGMAGYRMWRDGQYTLSGRPINDPGQPGPRKLAGSEAIGKSLGFQPVSNRKSYDQYRSRQVKTQVRSEKAGELANRLVRAFRDHDRRKVHEIQAEWKAWNREMKAEGKPWMQITSTNLATRVKARAKVHKVSRRDIGMVLEQMKAY